MTRVSEGLSPVVKTLTVSAAPQRAFDIFLQRMEEWWPLHRMAVSPRVKGAPPVSLTVEAREGGRIYETAPDGETFEWGVIELCEPGLRVAFSWRPGLPEEKATRVEVRFEPSGDGTKVTLVHSGWDKRPGGAEARGDYVPGWDYVLGECFGGFARSA